MTKNKKLTTVEIDNAVYGKNGLFEQTVDLIENATIEKRQEVMKITGMSDQSLRNFRTRPPAKLDTIIKIANAFGVK